MDIDYVTKLARMKLSSDEKKKFSKQLMDILDYIHKLGELDTKDVEPTHRLYHGQIKYRSDKVDPFPTTDILRGAPKSRDDFFIVPPVIE